jgi:hypothetical protein
MIKVESERRKGTLSGLVLGKTTVLVIPWPPRLTNCHPKEIAPGILAIWADLTSEFLNDKRLVFAGHRRGKGGLSRAFLVNSRPKPCQSSFLASLPRFDNSQNVKMSSSGQLALKEWLCASGILPGGTLK